MMKKTVIAAMLALASVSVPSARAQFSTGQPPVNPYFRQQFSPFYAYSAASGGQFGPYLAGPLGLRNAVRYGTPITPEGAFGNGQQGNNELPQLPPDWENVTGHPTRFMAYSGYFLNPGAASSGSGASGGPIQRNATLYGAGPSRPTQPGVRPPRGRENTTQGR